MSIEASTAWRPRLIGVIHLPALPGAPGWHPEGGMEAVVERALADADAYHRGGADALCIENFGDAPFFPGQVPPETVAAMAVAGCEVRRTIPLPLGFNVLRCDPAGALGLAAACGGRFIRVNVHTGASVTDQGLLLGQAHDTVRRRNWIAPGAQIWADIDVKHAAPLAPRPLSELARETAHRGLADGLIVSGVATGASVDPDHVRTAREACPDSAIYLGSGTNPESLPALLPHIDGAIVGSWVKKGGQLSQPVDPDRVRRLADLLAG